MESVLIPKSELNNILGGIMSEYRLAAPVIEDGILLFKDAASVSDILLNDEITYKSPKEFLFPQLEKIMAFEEDGASDTVQDTRCRVIFGVRPCDLEALNIMSTVFTTGKFIDSYYVNNLENSIIVGLGCKSEKIGCFCSERQVDKGFSAFCDVFLIDSGDNYTAMIITEKGQALLEKFNLSNLEAGADPKNAPGAMDALQIDADENTLFDKVDWGKIAEKCLGCGTCTYVCPTCHCFEFRDVEEKGVHYRYRCWDSCMYPKFTVHASGHNPRPSKKERYRQRILHKYLYMKQNFGYTACTGCGRCIRSCPAGMNIRSVIMGILEEIK